MSGRCYAQDIGGSWNCVYHAIYLKGEPCVAPESFPCEHKTCTNERMNILDKYNGRCPRCNHDEIQLEDFGELYCSYCSARWENFFQYQDECEPYFREWDLENRIDRTEEVLKDICHHVGKDCFATCKGDWSGTSCCTYRIWDALSSSVNKGEEMKK